MKERPTSVTVFAIINLVFAMLGVLFLTFAVIMRLDMISLPGMEDTPKFQLMQNNFGYSLLADVLTGLGIVATIIIIAASIGMFTLKPWARLATIGWSIYALVSGLLMTIVDHILVVTPTLAQFENKPEYSVVLIFTVVGYVIASFFFGYYLLMIFMLMRTHVVHAFTPDPLDDDVYNAPGPSPADSGGTLP